MRLVPAGLGLAACACILLGVPAQAADPPSGCPAVDIQTVDGWGTRDVVTGLPYQDTPVWEAYGVSGGACLGPWGVAFSRGRLYVAAQGSPGGLYDFPAAGGAASTEHQLNEVPFQTQPVAVDGHLYLPVNAQSPTNGRIVEISPDDGRVVRTVASGLSCPGYLAVDDLTTRHPAGTSVDEAAAEPSG